jgi:heme-NO-binding protein
VQGIFLDELEKFVVRELGQTGLARVRGLTGRGDGGYRFDGSYPDDELRLIVRGIAEATGTHPVDLLEMYSEGMVPGLLEVYGFLVDPRWSFIDFLVNTPDVIHKGLKVSSPAAKPPDMQVQRVGPESVAIFYRSKRRLCSVAKGIIRGAAKHYQVEVAIGEERCMLRGDPECVITVSAQK